MVILGQKGRWNTTQIYSKYICIHEYIGYIHDQLYVLSRNRYIFASLTGGYCSLWQDLIWECKIRVPAVLSALIICIYTVYIYANILQIHIRIYTYYIYNKINNLYHFQEHLYPFSILTLKKTHTCIFQKWEKLPSMEFFFRPCAMCCLLFCLWIDGSCNKICWCNQTEITIGRDSEKTPLFFFLTKNYD